jgi:NNP family nitrate/nitrite transporter-like MFS transporter
MTTPPPARGHLPTLIACFLHFDLSFMLWVLLGALGVFVAEDLRLSPAEKGLVVALPLLTGSLLRVPVGFASDRFGGKRVALSLLALVGLAVVVAWRGAAGIPSLVMAALLLGAGGASFAVALPLASRWYPPERQGLVMGIAAAGNSGTVLTNLIAPALATVIGWRGVFGAALLPLAAVAIAFQVMARESPGGRAPASIGATWRALRESDLWWFCLFYAVTFGGYVGLGTFLPLFLRDQFAVDAMTAGRLTALAALVGSFSRPVGGVMADRFGGVRVLTLALGGIGIVYAFAARLPGLGSMMVLTVLGMALFGMGNGAVFQLVPQRFRQHLGAATGVVGAVGGLGGFLLPALLGILKQTTGSFGPAFALFGGAAFGAAAWLQWLVSREAGWRQSWRRALDFAEET